MSSVPRWIATWALVAAAGVGSCAKPTPTSSALSPHASIVAVEPSSAPAPYSSAPVQPSSTPAQNSPLASDFPVPASRVEAVINPKQENPYAGPTGVVEGVVKIKGDKAPVQELKLPAVCERARPTYEKLFREGTGRVLPDVLVAVTDYEGYVPPRAAATQVQVQDCAFDRRTVVMTFGQRLEVSNLDGQQSYTPILAGVNSPSHSVLPPKGQGAAVKLYPLDIGRLRLVDDMNHPWMTADVFVLKYSTATITGLEGRFRIEGLPIGKVKVSAYLPSAELVQTVEATVYAGKPTTVDLTLEYKKSAPAASASTPAPKSPIVK